MIVQPGSISLHSIFHTRFVMGTKNLQVYPSILEISATSCFELTCCRHSVKPGSIKCERTCILHSIQIQHQKYCREPLLTTIYWRQEISNYVLKNPAYFNFYLILPLLLLSQQRLVLECFTSKIGLGTPNFPDISLKWNSMQRNIAHKLFIIMIDFT